MSISCSRTAPLTLSAVPQETPSKPPASPLFHPLQRLLQTYSPHPALSVDDLPIYSSPTSIPFLPFPGTRLHLLWNIAPLIMMSLVWILSLSLVGFFPLRHRILWILQHLPGPCLKDWQPLNTGGPRVLCKALFFITLHTFLGCPHIHPTKSGASEETEPHQLF